MSAGRLPCLLHFLGLATTLAVAKVVLSSVGVALFLAEEGPDSLPAFYVLLALVAIVLSAASSGVVDRLPRLTLGQIAFLGTLLAAAALRLLIAVDLPGAYYAVLASAHIYEIALDIIFWVVVAAFLDTLELKRSTPLLYMALAAGGVAGGLLTSALTPLVATADLLLALPVLGAVATLQFEFAKRRLQELKDRDASEDAPSGREQLGLLLRLIGRYPLILLIALNALMLTVLYGLCEYLVFSVYAARFTDEATLTRFLALMFAAIQVVEFGLLYALSRPLLERAGPLARNLVFPLTSLGCLLGLAAGQKLPAAIVTHVNAEAISNAVFQPINNTNYLALPLRFHGRVRTLADGVFYPGGLALAGLMLLWAQDQVALAGMTFLAVTCALVFILLNVAVGVLFLPTLLSNLRSGVVPFAEAAAARAASVAIRAEEVAQLLRRGDPEMRALGLDLARHFPPERFFDELRGLAAGADRPTRRRISGLLARTAPAQQRTLLGELLAGDDEPGQLIALQAALASAPEALPPGAAERLAGAPSRPVAALARLAACAPGAPGCVPGLLAELLPWCREAAVADEVIDACRHARHSDRADLLVALIEVAPLEQQRAALAALRPIVASDNARAAALGCRLAQHHDVRLRVEAIGVLGAVAAVPGALEALAEALADHHRLVRESAVAALAGQGNRPIPLVTRKLPVRNPQVVDAAIRTLGRIGSRRAHDALRVLLTGTYADAARNLAWLRQLPQGDERARWRALEIALQDHNQRLVDMVLSLIGAFGAPRSLGDLRDALHADDRRTRANALEALLSSPQRRLVQPIVPLLEALHGNWRPPEAPTLDRAALLAAAARATDRWVRCGAVSTARELGIAVVPCEQDDDAPQAASGAAGWAGGRRAISVTESDMDRVLFLKRVPLFRHLPLDTLMAVSRALQRSNYVAGEVILKAGARWEQFSMIESGAVELAGADGTVEELSVGGHFGELVLVDEAVRAPAVVAAQDCTLLQLHRIVFHDLSRDHPEMLMELCKLLARQVRHMQAQAPG